MGAKQMLSGFGSKAVGSLGILACQQTKIGFFNDQMLIASFGADGTITVGNDNLLGCMHLKCHLPTMAASFMPNFLSNTHKTSL